VELKETMMFLEQNYKKLATKDQGFALSLVHQYTDKGFLSPKQQSWAEKLLSWTTGIPTPKKEATVVGDFSGVYALFAAAKEHLKYPKIKLMISQNGEEGAKPLMLALAGSKSKLPGVVNVTDGGKYGENVWYGRVYPEGKFEGNSTVAAGDLILVEKMLKTLAADPAKVVSDYGKMTGNCSFCDAPLSHENSTAVGYGPVCAKHFGLYDQWKVAAEKGGMSEHDVKIATEKAKFVATKKPVLPAHLYGKPIFSLKPPGKFVLNLEVNAAAAQKALDKAASLISKAVAESVDAEIMKGMNAKDSDPVPASRVPAPVASKKKVIADKEKDEYLF